MAKKNKYLVFIGQAMDIKDKKLQIYGAVFSVREKPIQTLVKEVDSIRNLLKHPLLKRECKDTTMTPDRIKLISTIESYTFLNSDDEWYTVNLTE